MRDKTRCDWSVCSGGDKDIYTNYHDKEWGVPVYDDKKLFEFIVLEGMQAGLSWITILKKRENLRKAFDGFDPEKIAEYDSSKIEELLSNKGIIRHKLKISSVINNARLYLDIKSAQGSFSRYIWGFVDGNPINNSWKNAKEIPSETNISKLMSKDLKQKRFKFVGPTICYSFMQAVGMVNDHTTNCFRYKEILERQKR